MRIFVFAVLALTAALFAVGVLGSVALFANGLIGPGLAAVVAAVVFGLMTRSLFRQLQQPS